jgi:hypothetical protein
MIWVTRQKVPYLLFEILGHYHPKMGSDIAKISPIAKSRETKLSLFDPGTKLSLRDKIVPVETILSQRQFCPWSVGPPSGGFAMRDETIVLAFIYPYSYSIPNSNLDPLYYCSLGARNPSEAFSCLCGSTKRKKLKNMIPYDDDVTIQKRKSFGVTSVSGLCDILKTRTLIDSLPCIV